MPRPSCSPTKASLFLVCVLLLVAPLPGSCSQRVAWPRDMVKVPAAYAVEAEPPLESLYEEVHEQLLELSPTCGAVLRYMRKAQGAMVSTTFLERLRELSARALRAREGPRGLEYAEALLRTLRVLSNANAVMVSMMTQFYDHDSDSRRLHFPCHRAQGFLS
jgi:hypothetical protein